MRQETPAKLSKGPFPLQTTVFLIPVPLRQVKEQLGLQKAPVRVLFHQREDLALSLVKTGHVTLFQVPPSFFFCCRVQIHLKVLERIELFTEKSHKCTYFDSLFLCYLTYAILFFLMHSLKAFYASLERRVL